MLSTGLLSNPHGSILGMGDQHDRLKQARAQAGFNSARGAAIRHGWVPSTYASHENGQAKNIPREDAVKYARAFKISVAWLLHEEGPMRPGKDSNRAAELFKAMPPEQQAAALDFLEYLARKRP